MLGEACYLMWEKLMHCLAGPLSERVSCLFVGIQLHPSHYLMGSLFGGVAWYVEPVLCLFALSRREQQEVLTSTLESV